MVGGVAVGRTASTTTDEMFVKDSEGGNPGTKKNSAKLMKAMLQSSNMKPKLTSKVIWRLHQLLSYRRYGLHKSGEHIAIMNFD